VAPFTEQDTLVHDCHPPVTGTWQPPTTLPVEPSRRSSMVPPLPAEATRAVKDAAPEPKAAPVT
jgi:hypothetical protein